MLAVLLMVQVLVTGDADREVVRFFVDTGQKRRAGLWLITDGVSGQVLVVDTVKVGWKSIAAVPCYSLPRRDSGLVVSERWQRYRLSTRVALSSERCTSWLRAEDAGQAQEWWNARSYLRQVGV